VPNLEINNCCYTFFVLFSFLNKSEEKCFYQSQLLSPKKKKENVMINKGTKQSLFLTVKINTLNFFSTTQEQENKNTKKFRSYITVRSILFVVFLSFYFFLFKLINIHCWLLLLWLFLLIFSRRWFLIIFLIRCCCRLFSFVIIFWQFDFWFWFI